MCLHNEPVQQIDAPFCGDYIVNTEEGEECDCGGVDTCDDPCCHPHNCTLVPGSEVKVDVQAKQIVESTYFRLKSE